MCGVAINRLHRTPYQFYELTPKEFDIAIEDNNILVKEILNAHLQINFEAVRLHGMLMAQMNPYINKKPSKVEDVLRFTWDSDKPVKRQSVEEMKNILLQIADRHNQKLKTKQ